MTSARVKLGFFLLWIQFSYYILLVGICTPTKLWCLFNNNKKTYFTEAKFHLDLFLIKTEKKSPFFHWRNISPRLNLFRPSLEVTQLSLSSSSQMWFSIFRHLLYLFSVFRFSFLSFTKFFFAPFLVSFKRVFSN